MATGFGSTAAFWSRALGIGLTDEVVDLLKAGGVGTFGSLAFITSYQPGQLDERPLITALTQAVRRAPTNANALRAWTSAQRQSSVTIFGLQFVRWVWTRRWNGHHGKRLTSHSSEIMHSQKDLKLSLDYQGGVKVSTKVPKSRCQHQWSHPSTSSPQLKVKDRWPCTAM